MNKRWLYILCMVCLMAVTACRRVRPQGAANRTEPDSTAIALMEMNFRLATEADHKLVERVQQENLPYVLDISNFWYYREAPTDGREVKNGMHVVYTATIRNLDTNALIEEVEEEIEVGKRVTLRAIDICLPLMREGETFRLLAPYYNAYGRDGNEQVPPLTNVSILLTVNNITKI